MSTKDKKKIEKVVAVTMGDPTGLGGELVLRGRKKLAGGDICFGVLDSPERLERLAKYLEDDVRVIPVESWSEVADAFRDGLPVMPLSEEVVTMPGDSPDNEKALRMTRESIERGYDAAKRGEVMGLLTNPIDKGALMQTGWWSFKGHTDFLCYLDGLQEGEVVMMLEGGGDGEILRVVPVTIHVPLRQAVDDVCRSKVERVVQIVAAYLREDVGLEAEDIGVTGLNPHAGEGGLLGTEEQQEIEPAIRALQQQGYHCSGPYSADTMFIEPNRKRYDAIVCMTHDQALIGIKSLYFQDCVNVTLGLSVRRASPAHGVGRDIVGRIKDSAVQTASWERALAWLGMARGGSV